MKWHKFDIKSQTAIHRACRQEGKELYRTKFPFYFRIILFSNGRKNSKEKLREYCGFLLAIKQLNKAKRKKTQKKTPVTPHNLHPPHIAYLLPFFFSPLFKSHLLISNLFSFFFSVSFQTKEKQKKKRQENTKASCPYRVCSYVASFFFPFSNAISNQFCLIRTLSYLFLNIFCLIKIISYPFLSISIIICVFA